MKKYLPRSLGPLTTLFSRSAGACAVLTQVGLLTSLPGSQVSRVRLQQGLRRQGASLPGTCKVTD